MTGLAPCDGGSEGPSAAALLLHPARPTRTRKRIAPPVIPVGRRGVVFSLLRFNSSRVILELYDSRRAPVTVSASEQKIGPGPPWPPPTPRGRFLNMACRT